MCTWVASPQIWLHDTWITDICNILKGRVYVGLLSWKRNYFEGIEGNCVCFSLPTLFILIPWLLKHVSISSSLQREHLEFLNIFACEMFLYYGICLSTISLASFFHFDKMSMFLVVFGVKLLYIWKREANWSDQTSPTAHQTKVEFCISQV